MPDWTFTPGTDLEALIKDRLSKVVKKSAETIADSASSTAPTNTGKLARSVYTKLDGLSAEVGFTDSKAVGAHENMHDHLQGGKRPKFLELAMHEQSDNLMRNAHEALRGIFR